MKRIVLASGNRGKLVEIREILADNTIEWVAQSELGISDVEECGLSFVENALIKARHAAAASGLPALADDSGLIVAALNGAPGLTSARYAGTHGDAAANNRKLLAALADTAEDQRGAYFICVIVLLRSANDPAPLICQAQWHGRILESPRGERGFGYDPLFFDPVLNAAAAELDAATKNRVSHRGKALDQLRAALSQGAIDNPCR